MSSTVTPLNWGVIGTSAVARQFCAQLAKLPTSRLVHVVGTSADKAGAFASEFTVERSSSSIIELLADKEVRVVHISSPTRLHAEHALAALEAGKAVVCEKPFDTDSARFMSMTEMARQKELFCMEGMWMRFNPLVQIVRDIVRSGKLGEIRHIRAEIGYKSPLSRLEDPSRGPVWDFSVYALSLFHFLLGKPDRISGTTGSPGQPATVSGIGVWPGITASFTASIEAELANQAEIVGSKGRITLGAPFFCPSFVKTTNPEFPGTRLGDRWARLSQALAGKPVSETRFQRLADPQSGFYHQAVEVERCVRGNLLESPVVPHTHTLDVIGMAEALRESL